MKKKPVYEALRVAWLTLEPGSDAQIPETLASAWSKRPSFTSSAAPASRISSRVKKNRKAAKPAAAQLDGKLAHGQRVRVASVGSCWHNCAGKVIEHRFGETVGGMVSVLLDHKGAATDIPRRDLVAE